MKQQKEQDTEGGQPGPFALRLREVFMLALLVVSACLWIALVTYDINDPGWTCIGHSQTVVNSAGRVGAWLADVLFSLFGFLAFLFPLLLIWKAREVFRDRYEVSTWNWPVFILRFAGLWLVLVSACVLSELHCLQFGTGLPVSSGGILGKLVLDITLPALNRIGTSLIFLSLLLSGLMLLTDVSWFRLMDRAGQWALDGFFLLRKGFRKLAVTIAAYRERQVLEKIRQERGSVIQKEKNRQAEHTLPVIGLSSGKSESSVRAMEERQQVLPDETLPEGGLPAVNLLDVPDHSCKKGYSEETLQGMSRLLELKLKDFGVEAEVVAVHPGPVITRFEIQPAAGVKVSKITSIAKDIARSLAVISVRVVEVIPGKSVVGIEIPNKNREIVYFSELIASKVFDESESPLTLALGHDIGGHPVVANLARMPHLLVAGTTGSGKSVGVNAMILSMLYKASPEAVRLIMVDPKMLELSVYDGIPHLLAPVVTDMKEAANALRWCVAEMERRYRLMAAMGVRNLAGFNRKLEEAVTIGEPLRDPFYQPVSADDLAPELEKLPFIVVVIDEFADMMMIVGKKVEELIARIAQKARAAGIHLILATQRPSVDVITGLIKANIPTRISFQVSSKIDSRTVLDQGGGEQLLGHGDMLYLPPGTSLPVRVHGAFVSDNEVHRVVADWKKRQKPDYIEDVLSGVRDADSEAGAFGVGNDEEQDPLYDEAVAFVTETRRASISSVQRKLKIGYNRAARMIESMEAAGVISAMSSNGNREVIAPPPPRQ